MVHKTACRQAAKAKLQAVSNYAAKETKIFSLKLDRNIQVVILIFFSRTAICMNANAWLHLKNLSWFRSEVKRFILEADGGIKGVDDRAIDEEDDEIENGLIEKIKPTDVKQWGNWVQ